MTYAPIAASVAAATLGPTALLLARQRMHSPWAPGISETAAVAAITGIGFALVLYGPQPAAVLVPLVLLGPAAAIVDAREGRLPDLLTGPLLGTTVLVALGSGSAGLRGIAVAAFATAGASLVATLPGAMLGWGDVKLIPTLTIVVSHQNALLEGLIHAVLLVAVTAVIVGLRERRSVVPYGPALVFGTLGAAAGL
ncbi:prepilin peptidase [Pseudonocardia alaniniphila]|uniref:Prepilin peptidase n=1 Tax=Pseudonocardia alaniniphila TaxID=75291 RepID=A0ABS9T9H9_9PSEU|nr:prepilin peptidase [Pseudonocardia alaniniphila]MCH6165189.1 prepilin peptidase [Pseudonocardia alaniniphila]